MNVWLLPVSQAVKILLENSKDPLYKYRTIYEKQH